MYNLYDKRSGALLGTITRAQLQFLINQLEEETLEDQDYAITQMTLAYFETQGIDPELHRLLSTALGDKDELIIQWSEA
jgi:hypothetical protein